MTLHKFQVIIFIKDYLITKNVSNILDKEKSTIMLKLRPIIYKSFIFYFICLFLLSSILLTYIFIYTIIEEREKYELYELNNSYQIMDYVYENFLKLRSIINSIFYSKWYNHYLNHTGIYDSEFNVLERMAISNDLKIKALSMEFVSDILIITPTKNSIINTIGWYSINDYKKFYGQINIPSAENLGNLPIIFSKDDDTCILVLDDINVRYNKSTICVILNKEQFSKYIKQLKIENACYMEIRVDNQLLYELNKNDNNGFVTSCERDGIPNLQLTIIYPKYSVNSMSNSGFIYALGIIAALLFSMVLSFILTYKNIKPLNHVLEYFPSEVPTSIQAAYEYFDSGIRLMLAENAQINERNKNLNSTLSRYTSMIRNEVMFSMLTNPEFDFHDKYLCSIIPWINNLKFCILILFEIIDKFYYSDNIQDELIKILTDANHLQFQSLKIEKYETCFLLWFEDSNAMVNGKLVDCFLRDKIEDNNYYYYARSDIFEGPNKIYENYLLLKDKIYFLKHKSTQLPVTFQTKFIASIQKGNFDECKNAINSIRNHHRPETILLFLYSISEEYISKNGHFSKEMYSFETHRQHMLYKSDQEKWDIIINCANKICECTQDYKKGYYNDVSVSIEKYISTNFTNPDISLGLLAEKFFLSETLISKICKEYLGANFTDLVLDLRIKMAMKLLKDTNISLIRLSKIVGYNHYLTFKRAFARHQGISPKDYKG